MNTRSMSKVTVSLPSRLVEVADRMAEESSSTRSAVIAELLEREDKARREALMEEGYREWAEENRRLAEEVFPLAAEVVLRDG